MIERKPTMSVKKQIMIIDDEVSWLKVLKEVLQRRGYDVREASSGAEALKTLAQYEPDLILSDVRMPDMNGFDLLAKIKSLPRLAAKPFVFFSAIDDFHARKVAKDLGADEYLPKPMNVEDIDGILAKYLPR
jgi:CheY-like chemotaxis protein